MLSDFRVNIQKLSFRYKQFGGLRLVKAYIKMGMVLPTIKQLFNCAIHGRAFKYGYPKIQAEVNNLLFKQYKQMLLQTIEKYSDVESIRQENRPIWFCWMQGMDEAPDLVKACYASIRRNIQDRRIVVIEEKNWRRYVDLPQDILEKYEKGYIPHAHFSDLLRLQILIKYGGTWIDSTVLLSDFLSNKVLEGKMSEILEADLFFPQYVSAKTNSFSGISNWFISANANNRYLLMIRDMLYMYWRDYDCVVQYHVFHFFFALIARKCPEVVSAMPVAYSMPCLQLDSRMADDFDASWYGSLTEKVLFHKLNYRVPKKALENKSSFYYAILKLYGM